MSLIRYVTACCIACVAAYCEPAMARNPQVAPKARARPKMKVAPVVARREPAAVCLPVEGASPNTMHVMPATLVGEAVHAAISGGNCDAVMAAMANAINSQEVRQIEIIARTILESGMFDLIPEVMAQVIESGSLTAVEAFVSQYEAFLKIASPEIKKQMVASFSRWEKLGNCGLDGTRLWALQKLGEIYESRGETKKAQEMYDRLKAALDRMDAEAQKE